MPQVLENKASKTPVLKALRLYLRQRQEGIAIIWITAIIVAFVVLGSAIVATYNVSLFGQLDTSLSIRAQSLAASGYGFLYSEYKGRTNDVDRNQLLDELHGKTFNIAPDGKGGQFQLNITSYFYRLTENPVSQNQLKFRFIGGSNYAVPGDMPIPGYVRVGDNIYRYTNVQDTGSGNYKFTMQNVMPSMTVNTTIRPVVQANISGVATEGSNLTLGSGQGKLFPEENGMFLITKEKIKANLPVKTIVPYRYKNRIADQLFEIQRGPYQSSFISIDSSTAALIEVAKFVNIESSGFAPGKSAALASKTNKYRLALDIADFSPGLKSYWSFDDVAAPGKDSYGTSGATLSGGVTHTTSGKVGGALVFDVTKTGYVKTTFNPARAVGSNRSFSVDFWAKPGADVITQQGVVGVYESGQNFYIGIRNQYWEWGLGNKQHYYTGSAWNLADAPPLPKAKPDEWQHIAFIYDQTLDDVVFYFNGIEKFRYENFTTTKGGIVTLPSRDIYLGALYDPNTSSNIYGFTGSLDEVAVFNRALTFCEVNAIFKVPASLPCNIGCDANLYFSFNGNADDNSGTNWDGNPPPGYDGTVIGATLTNDQCDYANQAYYFDGNDYINTTFNPKTVIGDGNPFTVAFWAKPNQVTSLEAAVGAMNVGQLTQRFYVAVYQGEWLWGYGNTRGPSGSLPVAVANQWAHIGYVYDKTTGKIRFYLNGVEYIYNYTGDGVLPNFNVNVGGRKTEGGVDSRFTGTADEVLIWKEAKTATYMLNLYNGTNP